jgi:hypothetical protein
MVRPLLSHRPMRTVLLSTLLLAGCPSDNPSSSTTITLDTIGPPDLVAVKLGTGDWQTLERDGNLYEIEVDEPYIVAVSCNDADGLFDTYLIARTPEDDRELSAPCTGNGPPIAGAIQGTLVQPGEVIVGFTSVPSVDGAFEIESAAGARELVALTDTAIAIREVEVDGLTQLTPALDIDGEGGALVPAGFTIANAAVDEDPFAFARLFTEHQTFAILGFGDPDTLQLAPDSVLGDEDAQLVTVMLSRENLSRSVSLRDVRASTERAVTLPEYLSGVTLDESGGTVSATWGELPDHDSISFTIDQTAGSQFLYADLQISPAYADEMGTSIALDLAIPGFDPAGAIDTTATYTRTFSALTNLDDRIEQSQLSEVLNQESSKRRLSQPTALLRKAALRSAK